MDEYDLPPKVAYYLARGAFSRPIDLLMRVPLDKCRSFDLIGYSQSRYSESPFIQTCLQYAKSDMQSYDNSLLQKYYARCQPLSAAEIIDLPDLSNTCFYQLQPMIAIKPWSDEAPYGLKQLERQRLRNLAIENIEGGVPEGAEGGQQCYGPVSQAKGEWEYHRLVNTFENIRRNGNRADIYGHIRVSYLDAGQQWRYQVHVGHHRIAALAALGYTDVVMRVSPIVTRREDASFWPAVRQGIYTAVEAVALFDRFFQGEQPKVACNWMKKRNSAIA